MRFIATLLILAAAAFADGTLHGTFADGQCLYLGKDFGVRPEHGRCRLLSTWRLSTATPVLDTGSGTYRTVACSYERGIDGAPLHSLPAGRTCHDVVVLDSGRPVGHFDYSDDSPMDAFFDSPCDIIDQSLKYSEKALRELPEYRRQVLYRLAFPWRLVRQSCILSRQTR